MQRFHWLKLGFTGFHWVLLGFIEFYWVLLGFTGLYWALQGFTGFYLLKLGFTGFYWVSLRIEQNETELGLNIKEATKTVRDEVYRPSPFPGRQLAGRCGAFNAIGPPARDGQRSNAGSGGTATKNQRPKSQNVSL